MDALTDFSSGQFDPQGSRSDAAGLAEIEVAEAVDKQFAGQVGAHGGGALCALAGSIRNGASPSTEASAVTACARPTDTDFL